MPLTASERKLQASIAGHTSWANTEDRSARTSNARQTFRDSFQDKVDPGHTLSPQERARRGESAYKAHMSRMAFNSAKARRLKAEQRSLEAQKRRQEAS